PKPTKGRGTDAHRRNPSPVAYFFYCRLRAGYPTLRAVFAGWKDRRRNLGWAHVRHHRIRVYALRWTAERAKEVARGAHGTCQIVDARPSMAGLPCLPPHHLSLGVWPWRVANHGVNAAVRLRLGEWIGGCGTATLHASDDDPRSSDGNHLRPDRQRAGSA